MQKILFSLFLLFSTAALAAIHPESSPFKKVVIVVFENADVDEVLAQPTFRFLSKQGAFFNNFHAVERPSLPNYIAMTSASTWGVKNNGPVNLDVKNIVDLLEEKHFTWKAYAEDYPGDCYLGDQSGEYVRKHNPFMSYTDITSDPRRCARIVNAQEEFQTDVDAHKLPDYSFYIPNLINNGHNNGPVDADKWLREFYFNVMLNPYVAKSDVLFILTFDESDPNKAEGFAANRVYTLFYGTMINKVELNEYYDFYNLLTTLEDFWGLKTFKLNDQNSVPVSQKVWKCHSYDTECLATETY
jgi:hypothetical protein